MGVHVLRLLNFGFPPPEIFAVDRQAGRQIYTQRPRFAFAGSGAVIAIRYGRLQSQSTVQLNFLL